MTSAAAISGNKDEHLQAADMAYLSKSKMDEVLANTMQEVLIARPDDPVQFMIDCIKNAPQFAAADGAPGTKAENGQGDAAAAESTDGAGSQQG